MHHGHHLTPSQVADDFGLSEEEVLRLCAETPVPVLHGRIDWTLFELATGLPRQKQTTRFAA